MRVHDGTLYTVGIDDSLKQVDIEGKYGDNFAYDILMLIF